jgi:predicted metal-binding protein
VGDVVAESETMLRPLPAAASLVVCSTCRLSKEARADGEGRSGGELLRHALSAALADHPCRGRIDIQAMPCLFACSSHCTLYIRGGARLGYILGRFVPSRSDAAALLDYVAKYLDSDDGVVPYASWPAGIKGHFLVRVPPDGFIWNPPA